MALCGARCDEEADSPYHTFRCSKRAVDTADHLALAWLEDKLPEDPGTLEDFGFSAFLSFEGRSKLLGLYIGLLCQNISTRTLHKWQVDGNLSDKIVSTYVTLPENNRGGYFPWFLENRHLLENVMTKKVKLSSIL